MGDHGLHRPGIATAVRGLLGSHRPGSQDDEEEEEEDEEVVHDLTGGGALAAVQPPAAPAVPGLRNTPRECAIRMPCIRVLVGGCCRGRCAICFSLTLFFVSVVN